MILDRYEGLSDDLYPGVCCAMSLDNLNVITVPRLIELTNAYATGFTMSGNLRYEEAYLEANGYDSLIWFANDEDMLAFKMSWPD